VSPGNEHPRTGDSASGTVCQNSSAAYAESVTVVLVPSVSIRYAESLGTHQYCIRGWPNEMVYLTKLLK
jgi:hypothetical protein